LEDIGVRRIDFQSKVEEVFSASATEGQSEGIEDTMERGVPQIMGWIHPYLYLHDERVYDIMVDFICIQRISRRRIFAACSLLS
jgi:hypothetical protein